MIKHLRQTMSLDGRLNRLGYWRWQLALTCISAAALVGSTLLAMNGAPKLVSGLVLGAIGLAILATVPIVIRRLHDRGRSGWWLVPFVILPWILPGAASGLTYAGMPIFAEQSPLFWPITVVMLVLTALSIWGFVEISLLKGQSAANRFGPPPA
ncbi:hypothetical protein D3C86_1663330 [compost metagenome]